MTGIVRVLRIIEYEGERQWVEKTIERSLHGRKQMTLGTITATTLYEFPICLEKAKAEVLLKAAILEKLNELPGGQLVMLKLTLPEQDDLYADCVSHPNVVRVVALSGGYTREEANNRLRRNHGIVASFSRALVEGLSAQQSDTEFNALLDASIQSIFEASNT
jgi:fructose-bisphosphate aldolase class 1